jgi:hypothetical protein
VRVPISAPQKLSRAALSSFGQLFPPSHQFLGLSQLFPARHLLRRPSQLFPTSHLFLRLSRLFPPSHLFLRLSQLFPAAVSPLTAITGALAALIAKAQINP